jgi:hypothetical protein
MRFFGNDAQGQMAGAGQFHCSFCKRLSLYALFEVRNRFHVFWLPIKSGPKERLVICGRCQGQLPGEVLELSDSFPIPWPPGSHLKDRPKPRHDGQRVLARWPFEPFWYPATVKNRDGERVWVHYDDGHKACLPEEQVSELDLGVGDDIFARWKCGPIYYPGKITRKLGEEIHIEYEDGDWEETTISVVRVLREYDEDDEGEEWRWRSQQE